MLFLKGSLRVVCVSIFVIFPIFAQEEAFLGDSPSSSHQESSEEFSRELFLMQYTLIEPTKYPQVSRDGRFVVSSVESYVVGAQNVWGCSFVARKNISLLLDAMGKSGQGIAQGDANDLIHFGLLSHKLIEFIDKKRIISVLDNRFNNQSETVFDVYRYVPSRSSLLRSHRVAVFLGDDTNWYVLDPNDGDQTQNPQLFSQYLKNDVVEATWYIRIPGYTFIDPLEVDQFESVFPYFSSELRAFFQTNYFEIPHVLAPDMLSFAQDG